MSTLGTTQSRLSADDRYELAAKAQSQHRLNYPSHLIAMGFVLVALSMVILIFAWLSRASAIETHQRKLAELGAIERLIDEIQTLNLAQQSNPQADQHQPIPDIFSRLERFATQAKLVNKLVLPNNRANQNRVRQVGNNARQMNYPYTLRDPSLEHLLEWIRISTTQIPGLEVTDLTIKPAKQDWTMVVTLSRYERNQ